MHSTAFKVFAAGVAVLAVALGGLGLYALTAAPPAPTDSPVPPVEGPSFAAAPVPKVSAKEWAERHTLTHNHAISAVALGNGVIAVGDANSVLKLWDTETGKEKETLGIGSDGGGRADIHRLQVTPDRALLVTVLNGGGAMHNCSLRKDGRDYAGFGDSGEWVYHGISADGRFWLRHKPGEKDLHLMKYDAGKGRFTNTREAEFRHPSTIQFAAAAGENAVATLTNNRTKPVLRLWSAGKEKPVWQAELGQMDVTNVLIAPGGKLVAVTGDAGQVRVFDAKTGKEAAKADKLTGAVWAAAFSPDGTRLVVGAEDKVARVIDAETGKELAVLKGHKEAVTAVAFGPDGNTIATGSADKTVKLWELKK